MGQEEVQNQPTILQQTFAAYSPHTKSLRGLYGDYNALGLYWLHTWHPQIPKIK